MEVKHLISHSFACDCWHFIRMLKTFEWRVKLVFCAQASSHSENKNKNVDNKLSAHNVFLEKPSSGTLKAKLYERQVI